MVDKLVQGGGETLLTKIISSINKEKYDITVLNLGATVESIKSTIQNKGANVKQVKQKKAQSSKISPFFIYGVYESVRKENPDIIHSYSLYTNVLARIISLVLKYKIVSHYHGNPNYLPTIPLIASTSSDSRSEINICVSRSTKNGLKKYDMSGSLLKNKNRKVIHNSIDEDLIVSKKDAIKQSTERHSECKKRYIVSVGRLVPVKNHKTTIRAIKKMRSDGFNVILDIFGNGPRENELKCITRKFGIEECVNIRGRVKRKRVIKELEESDFFICSSKAEGFGIALLEAMATGCVCLASNIAVFREVRGNSRNPILFDPFDANELANKLKSLISNKSDFDDLVSDGLSRATKFVDSKCLSKYRRIYDNINDNTV
ncbi:glycosyltransferase family 4 protein [Salinibacter ruber]|uniref:glycosyltransferase family 4 protein n=1 Tax=Salinibacter ruber TaxID=146919 RepID=UPI00216816EE|nr:glycosyltransferase family 4 protein [Salinibacter ruber]MCS4142404.1 glycosyltransferase involved in cell wall biosynthesis [Salinibacter ruber]